MIPGWVLPCVRRCIMYNFHLWIQTKTCRKACLHTHINTLLFVKGSLSSKHFCACAVCFYLFSIEHFHSSVLWGSWCAFNRTIFKYLASHASAVNECLPKAYFCCAKLSFLLLAQTIHLDAGRKHKRWRINLTWPSPNHWLYQQKPNRTIVLAVLLVITAGKLGFPKMYYKMWVLHQCTNFCYLGSVTSRYTTLFIFTQVCVIVLIRCNSWHQSNNILL